MELAESVLKAWENFYVIVGSSAAALTGLVFVVITIVAGDASRQRSKEGTATFTTPTVVHFGTALLVGMLLSVPWRSLAHAATPLALVGLGGLAYVVRTAIRIRRMENYDADTEDWSWHTLLPFVSYALITVGAFAFAFVAFPVTAMFAFAIASALLIFIGIHNAWDIVTYLAVQTAQSAPADDASKKTKPDG